MILHACMYGIMYMYMYVRCVIPEPLHLSFISCHLRTYSLSPLQGRSLSLKTFFVWMLISLYQGGVIMLLGFLLFKGQFVHVIAITFTSLIVNELLVVALTVRTWHGLMVLAELFSVLLYVVSLVVLKDYFGKVE